MYRAVNTCETMSTPPKLQSATMTEPATAATGNVGGREFCNGNNNIWRNGASNDGFLDVNTWFLVCNPLVVVAQTITGSNETHTCWRRVGAVLRGGTGVFGIPLQ